MGHPSPKRIVAGLAVCQILLLSNGVLMATVNALTGFALAPSRRMATIPIVTYVLGAAVSTLPASFFMKRRRGEEARAARGERDQHEGEREVRRRPLLHGSPWVRVRLALKVWRSLSS
jgi:hypothetical protein